MLKTEKRCPVHIFFAIEKMGKYCSRSEGYVAKILAEDTSKIALFLVASANKLPQIAFDAWTQVDLGD